jgi:DNA uptake protein ComE-like DNA-binding protein
MFQGNPFDVSKRHQRGVWVLIVLSIVIIFTPRILQCFIDKSEVFQVEVLPYHREKPWNNQQRKYRQHWRYHKKRWPSKKKFTGRKPTHPFDPNHLSKEEWMSFGLSEKQAEVVLKFTKRGIQSNEELQRIKFIPPQVFENIKNFTQYPIETEGKGDETIPKEQGIQKLDLNQATEEQLTELKGLGSFFARQTVKYRAQLGGFSHKDQLREVWKMTEERYLQVQGQLTCASVELVKLNINTDSAEKLQAHPYLNWNQANSIVKMRQQRGGFKSIEEIKESVIIDQETFEKVRPYLSL